MRRSKNITRLSILLRVVFALLFAVTSLPRPAEADPPPSPPLSLSQAGDYNFERIMVKQFDYVFYCDMQIMDKYMHYKPAPMSGPYVRIMVTFQRCPKISRASGTTFYDPQKYEEFWFHAGKCVGMHRYTEVYLNQNSTSGLYFRGYGNNVLCEHSVDLCDCAVRLIMEIYYKRSILGGVIVPAECFPAVTSDLGQFNFFVLTSTANGEGENMSMHLECYPRMAVPEKYFYYDDTGRR